MAGSGDQDRKNGCGTVDAPGMDYQFDFNPTPQPPLHSEFERDPDLRDLVILFVDDLENRAESIRIAHQNEDFPTLRRLAHQIKGSAGGYGFHPIGDAAGRLEYELLGDQADMPTISQRVEDLISTCLAAVRPEIS